MFFKYRLFKQIDRSTASHSLFSSRRLLTLFSACGFSSLLTFSCITSCVRYKMAAAAVADVQHERAFQKQEAIFIGNKRLLPKKSAAGLRYWKKVGLGFTTPKEAKVGRYVDKKCPFTGNVSIRGRILKGMVISTKMKRTIVIRRNYLHYVRKYNRFEKRHKNVSCHCSPAFDHVTEGDIVTAGQCRPLSKTVRFNVLKVEKNEIFGSSRKQFRLF
ncbi:ribosomal protein RPS11 [Cardiosporidium cionae]|uniref:Ribosomal protein RPS11 n=1 Tax=Cardiosporidium cionae TaxID=476202 RepID=A0ABQ7J6T5_9APIC|nr:ribosomal protein RPS11 [Cardiosporidium cionae]|eukprot:KAF8819681.1 ribosomal protein RPS11 [Cardiosporidium cionae]